MCLQNPIHFIKLRIQAVSLLLGVALLSACAATDSAKQQASAGASLPSPAISQPAIGKKVQTARELITKLKEGFYSAALTQPEFYARELGYPLKEPFYYSPWNARDLGIPVEKSQMQEIIFDEGELTHAKMELRSQTEKNGISYAYISVYPLFAKLCLYETQLFDYWPRDSLVEDKFPSPYLHDQSKVPKVWRTKHLVKSKEYTAGFSFRYDTLCLVSFGFSAAN